MENSLTFSVSPERVTGERLGGKFWVKIDGKLIETDRYMYWEMVAKRDGEFHSCEPFPYRARADIWKYTEVKRIARFLNESKIPPDASSGDLYEFADLAFGKEGKRQCDVSNAHRTGMKVADYRIQTAKNS